MAGSLLATLRAALRRERRDYTTGNLDRAIVLLAIPMALEVIMEHLFAVVDIFWVSRLGADAVAVVGMTEALMVIIFALAMGFSMAAAAIVARRTGEKDPEGASRAAVQALILGLLTSSILGVVGAALAPDLLRLLGASEAVIGQGSTFARIMLGGNATVFFLFLINAMFRGAGDATLAMRVLWLANLINIVLGPVLIFGVGPFPALGVTGAAVATNIGRGVGVLCQLYMLIRGGGHLVIGRRHLRLDFVAMRSMVRVAAGGIAQALIASASWLPLLAIMTPFGSGAVAGLTIALRVFNLAIFPSNGLSGAAATLVGQNLGAANPERAEAAVWRAGRWNLYTLCAIGVTLVATAEPIAALFTSDPAVARWAIAALYILAAALPVLAYGFVVVAAFNGAGDTRTPTVLNACCLWIWEIPLAWFLSHVLGFGPHGVYAAVALGFSAQAASAIVLFRRGRWRTQKV